MYRIRPSVQHTPRHFTPFTTKSGNFISPPMQTADLTPEAYRFRPLPAAGPGIDFLDGLFTMGGHGSPVGGEGASASLYAISASMTNRVFRNQDGDMLIMPQNGNLLIRTEFGILEVEPCEFAIIPRGIVFQVELPAGVTSASGYVLENFGHPFIIPDMGPIGISSGLAHPRHFLAPQAKFIDEEKKMELVAKFQGNLYHGDIAYNPFDVVAWYGSYTPTKYDLRVFMPVHPSAFDHADPCIGVVMQSPTAVAGVSNIDFVVFPPRWMVLENTFRPPWFHRNVMSEFMGIIKGSYDAKPGDSFPPGASSIHNQFSAHGPDGTAVAHALKEDTGVHTRYENTLAFMWESNRVWVPSPFAIEKLYDSNYVDCWKNVPKTFDPTKPGEQKLPFNPDKQEIFNQATKVDEV